MIWLAPLMFGCPHRGIDEPPEALVPDALALCALIQEGGPEDVVRVRTEALGYEDVFVGDYGTLDVVLPAAVPLSLLVDAWGPGAPVTPLHWDDPDRLRFTLTGPPCSAFATVAGNGSVARLMVRDERL